MGNIRTSRPGILLPALLLISALFMWLPVRPAHAFHHPPALAQSLTHAARAMSVGTVGTNPPPAGQGVVGNYWISALSGPQGIPTYDTIGTGNLGYVNCTVWKKVSQMGGAIWQKTGGINVTISAFVVNAGANDKAWPSTNAPLGSSITVTSLTGGGVSSSWIGEAQTGSMTVAWSADAGSNQINRNETVYDAGGGDFVTGSLKHTRFTAGTSHVDCILPWPGATTDGMSTQVVGCAGYVDQPGTQGSYGVPADWNKFRIYIEILDASGSVTWNNDPTGTNGGNGNPQLVTVSGANTDTTTAPVTVFPVLPVNNGGYNERVSLQNSRQTLGVWSGWSQVYWWNGGPGIAIQAKRHFTVF